MVQIYMKFKKNGTNLHEIQKNGTNVHEIQKNGTNLHEIFFIWSHGIIMHVKIKMRQYVIFSQGKI